MSKINVIEFKRLIDSPERHLLIDVREHHEHEEFNIGGRNLPMGDIMQWLDDVRKESDCLKIIYCKSGNRSAMVAAFLIDKGITGVHSLSGGIKAWMTVEQGQ